MTSRKNPTAASALAVRRENGDKADNSMTNYIREMEPQFALAMPKGAEAGQLVRDGLTALRTTKNLDKCESQSVLGALMTCAQLGLRPSVPALGHAWVLPFFTPGIGYRAQLIIGYQGYVELAYRSPRVTGLVSRQVHEHDHFEVDYGIADTIVHKPHRGGPRGAVTDYYAIARYSGGGYAFWAMSRPEVEEHRDRFAMARKDGQIVGPWRDHFDAMASKTVVRMLAKYMPKGGALAAGIAVDGGIRLDLSPASDPLDVTEQPAVVEGDILDVQDEPAGDTDTPSSPVTPVDESDWERQ